jgi:hypothetical protein
VNALFIALEFALAGGEFAIAIRHAAKGDFGAPFVAALILGFFFLGIGMSFVGKGDRG